MSEQCWLSQIYWMMNKKIFCMGTVWFQRVMRNNSLSLILCYSFNSDGRLKIGIVADYLEVAMAKIVLAWMEQIAYTAKKI